MSTATYDGNGLRVSATTGSAAQAFTWDTTTEIPELLMDSANAYIYGGRQAPAEQVNLATGVIRYLVADTLGSVRGVVTSAGVLSATTTYDAWGNPSVVGGLAAKTPFGFAGCYTDGTGLIYLINRYYDPQTGQLLSVDPDVSQTWQPYAYASGNPVDVTDLNGLFSYPDSSKFFVDGVWNDRFGNRNIPLRRGYADDRGYHSQGFGYNHYCYYHDMFGKDIIGTAIRHGDRKLYTDPRKQDYEDRWSYLIEVYDSTLFETEDMKYISNVLVGVSFSGYYNNERLRDGKVLGVVTAFCPKSARHPLCEPFISAGNWTFQKAGNTQKPGLQA